MPACTALSRPAFALPAIAGMRASTRPNKRRLGLGGRTAAPRNRATARDCAVARHERRMRQPIVECAVFGICLAGHSSPPSSPTRADRRAPHAVCATCSSRCVEHGANDKHLTPNPTRANSRAPSHASTLGRRRLQFAKCRPSKQSNQQADAWPRDQESSLFVRYER